MNLGYKKIPIEKLVKLVIENNDNVALKELVNRIQKDIVIFFHYCDEKMETKNDLIQDILFKVVKNIKTLKNPLYFKNWLHKIIVNTYYDYLRKKKLQNQKICYEFDLAEKKCISPTDEPITSTVRHELNKKIRDALMKLHHNHRIIVLLRDYAGFSYDEIADILNVTKGTVKSRLARARNRLQQDLKEYL